MSMSITTEDARKEAEANGCEVVEGKSNVLLLDFDDAKSVDRYTELSGQLKKLFGVVKEEWWASKSKKPGHRHARITIDTNLSASDRSALQAALGSDGRRELFAIHDMLCGLVEPSILFRPKNSAIDTINHEAEADGTDRWSREEAIAVP